MEESLEDFREANNKLIEEIIKLRIRCNQHAVTADVDGIPLDGVHENASQDSTKSDATDQKTLPELNFSPILERDKTLSPASADPGTTETGSVAPAENQ
jgi:hypothetical protein